MALVRHEQLGLAPRARKRRIQDDLGSLTLAHARCVDKARASTSRASIRPPLFITAPMAAMMTTTMYPTTPIRSGRTSSCPWACPGSSTPARQCSRFPRAEDCDGNLATREVRILAILLGILPLDLLECQGRKPRRNNGISRRFTTTIISPHIGQGRRLSPRGPRARNQSIRKACHRRDWKSYRRLRRRGFGSGTRHRCAAARASGRFPDGARRLSFLPHCEH